MHHARANQSHTSFLLELFFFYLTNARRYFFRKMLLVFLKCCNRRVPHKYNYFFSFHQAPKQTENQFFRWLQLIFMKTKEVGEGKQCNCWFIYGDTSWNVAKQKFDSSPPTASVCVNVQRGDFFCFSSHIYISKCMFHTKNLEQLVSNVLLGIIYLKNSMLMSVLIRES